MTGQILGVPGHGLQDAGWAKNQQVAAKGAVGEKLTAQVLDRLATDGDATVMHDLRIPSSRYTANIDHVVVSGNRVLIVDSKLWKPGFVWTLGSKTRRGWDRFEPAEKRTMTLAHDSLQGYLVSAGQVRFPRPLVAVWPSRDQKMSMWAAHMPGARLVLGTQLHRHLGGMNKPASPRVVANLSRLLSVPPAPAVAAGAGAGAGRHPAGSSQGGQFTARGYAEPDLSSDEF